MWSRVPFPVASPGSSAILDCRYAGVNDIGQLSVNWYTYTLDADLVRKYTHIWKYSGATGSDEGVGQFSFLYSNTAKLSITEGHQIKLSHAMNNLLYECQVLYGSDMGTTTIKIFTKEGK